MNPNDLLKLQTAVATTPILESLAFDVSRSKKVPQAVRSALSMLVNSQDMGSIMGLKQKLGQGTALSPQEQMFLDNYSKRNIGDMAIAGTARRVRKVPKEKITSLINIEDLINRVIAGNFK